MRPTSSLFSLSFEPRWLMARLAAWLLGCSFGLHAWAADTPPAPPDRAALGSYVDGVVEAFMRESGIAGATVAVVDRDGALLLRGYGMAAQGSPPEPVDPERTVFRIGSVSKTFTYLEALRLLEAGKLDLDAPVNSYLPPDLQIPADDHAPALLRHLLSHSAGFEDLALGHLFHRDPAHVPTLHDYLIAHRPARVREPGTAAVYSNYGVALLGALVANVENLPFEDLVERDLFVPMGLRHTTFREPLVPQDARTVPVDFPGVWSHGFQRFAGGYVDDGFEHIAHVAPAGSASSDAADMARYMRMLLNDGELDGVRILPASLFARLAGEPLLRNAPGVDGWAYGFLQGHYGAFASLEHSGVTNLFLTRMVVVPQLGVGVFVSTNTGTGRALVTQLPNLLFEHFYLPAHAEQTPQPAAAPDPQRYRGVYLGERRPYTGFDKFLIAAGTSAHVDVLPSGELVVQRGGETTRWQPQERDLFRAGAKHLRFLTDAGDRVVALADAGDIADRVGGVDDPANASLLFNAAALLSVVVLIDAWRRRRKSSRDAARYAATVLRIGAGCWIAFCVTLTLATMDPAIDYTYPSALLRAALWFATAAGAASLLSVALLGLLRRSDWTPRRKLGHAGVVAFYLLGAYALWVWNALAWRA